MSQRDFDMALSELVPSVSQAEMDHYKAVQVSFRLYKAWRFHAYMYPKQKFNPTKAVNGTMSDSHNPSKGKGKEKARAG